MDQDQAFDEVRKYIYFLKENHYHIKQAYVFGSYARGKYSSDSDIDLALVMNDLQNTYTMQVELMKISRKFDTRIEPHPFDELDFDYSNPFAGEILSTGIRIC